MMAADWFAASKEKREVCAVGMVELQSFRLPSRHHYLWASPLCQSQ